MKIKKSDIKELIELLGFKPQEGEKDIYYKNYPSINKSDTETFEIPLVDISEQRKVITEFEKLETEIAQIETELATMDAQKEQILKKHLE